VDFRLHLSSSSSTTTAAAATIRSIPTTPTNSNRKQNINPSSSLDLRQVLRKRVGGGCEADRRPNHHSEPYPQVSSMQYPASASSLTTSSKGLYYHYQVPEPLWFPCGGVEDGLMTPNSSLSPRPIFSSAPSQDLPCQNNIRQPKILHKCIPFQPTFNQHPLEHYWHSVRRSFWKPRQSGWGIRPNLNTPSHAALCTENTWEEIFIWMENEEFCWCADRGGVEPNVFTWNYISMRNSRLKEAMGESSLSLLEIHFS